MAPRTTLLLSGLLITSALFCQNSIIKQVQLSEFDLQSSAIISASGEQLSLPAYHSPVYWFPVKVPSTVLTGLVANRVYPDPYTGMNNMLIPDASDSFNRQYNLEQVQSYSQCIQSLEESILVPDNLSGTCSGKGTALPADLQRYQLPGCRMGQWQQVADSTRMAGMFAEYFLDVTPYIRPGEMNALAVKIYPLDYPGLPAREQLKALDDFYENGGPTGDIGKNVTMLCSVGWDWIPPVRDRNMGIWQPVFLRTTGGVTISQPHVVTDLPDLPDTSTARLSLSFTSQI